MDRKRLLGLCHQSRRAVKYRDAVITALLDIGRVRALHKADETLIDDRFNRVTKDFQRHGIQGDLFHGMTSINRLQAASTLRRAPGKRTVVVSSCSMMAAPEAVAPLPKSRRSKTGQSIGAPSPK